jgi:hypothetical protein
MLDRHRPRTQRDTAKWCAYALALAVPGSFVVLPLWLLRRHWASRMAWRTLWLRRATGPRDGQPAASARRNATL